MKLLLIFIMALMSFTSTACTANYRQENLNSYIAGDFPQGPAPGQSLYSVAEDLANLLAASYPPGQTTIHLASGQTADNLAPLLESRLRALGFSITSEPQVAAKTVAYTLDNLDYGICYLKVTISDGQVFTRVYKLQGANLVVSGGLAKTGLAKTGLAKTGLAKTGK